MPVSLLTKCEMTWDPASAAQILHQWRNTVSLGHSQAYPTGFQFFTAGVPSSDLFLMAKGIVGLHFATPVGEPLVGLAYPGHLVCSVGINGPVCALFSATALTTCQAYRIDRRLLRGDAGELLERSLRTETQRHLAALAAFVTVQPLQRLEDILDELSVVLRDGGNSDFAKRVFPLSDSHLAMLVGVSTRQLKRLKHRLRHPEWLRSERRSLCRGGS